MRSRLISLILKIVYQNVQEAETNLYITDLLGNVVRNVFKATPPATSLIEENVNLSGLSSGIYFCILEVAGKKEVKKIIIN